MYTKNVDKSTRCVYYSVNIVTKEAPVTHSQLRIWRKSKKLSRSELGDLIGVSQYTIRSWERGTRTPRPKKMQTLFEVSQGEVQPNHFHMTNP